MIQNELREDNLASEFGAEQLHGCMFYFLRIVWIAMAIGLLFILSMVLHS